MKGEEQLRLRSWVEQLHLPDQLGLETRSDPSLPGTLDKLKVGQALDDAEVNSLEAIVMQAARPALIVADGTIETPAPPWDTLAVARPMIDAVLPAVGRIDASGLHGMLFAGTGFLVGPGLVMTSRTVAELFCTGVGTTDLQFREGAAPTIDFGSDGPSRSRVVPILKVELIHPFLDVALLRAASDTVLPLKLAAETSYPAGRMAVIVGHVAYDSDRGLDLLTRLYGHVLGRKHVSPGRIGTPQLFTNRGRQMLGLTHDCTTLSGSLGGPLIDLETGNVVGVHAYGRRFGGGFAIPVGELARDPRLLAAGVSLDPAALPSEHAWLDYWQQAEPGEAKAPTEPRRASRGSPDLDEVRGLCASAFPDTDALKAFLGRLGHEGVLRAVPPNLPPADYREALLKALDRRSLIDRRFVTALRGAVGGSTAAGDEVPDEPEGPALVGAVTPGPESLEAILPQDGDYFDLAYLARGIEAARAVVAVQATDAQGATTAGGTGWLLAPGLVVVPAHLLPGTDEKGEAAAGHAPSFIARFDYDTPQSSGTTVPVTKVELVDRTLDLALLRLGAGATDHAPLRVNPEPPVPGPGFLTMIHHPGLGAKKISMRGGRLVASDAHEVTYVIASEGGSAGAPVFDSEWRVVATHRAFRNARPSPDGAPQRTKLGTATSALLAALRDTGPESLWLEVVAAQPALKVIDATLYARLAELAGTEAVPTVPMILQVVDPSVVLEAVPDLRIGAREALLVTAVGTKASVDALALHPGVLSVKASSVGGAYECGVSIPHVGATRIHEDLGERGDRALVAFIDNGLDVFHEAFRDAAGRTRVVAFWDQKDARAPAGAAAAAQTAQAMSPAGEALVAACRLGYGALYVAEDLQAFLDDTRPLPATFPPAERMAHGTAVCSIAAGRRTGDDEGHFPGGLATESDIIMVRYDLQESSVGYAVGHMDALAFIDKVATANDDKPVVVNISNGMNAGAHDGTSPVEQRCREFTGGGGRPGRIVVKSAGNERGKGRHASLKVGRGAIEELRWQSADNGGGGRTFPETLEFWFPKGNQFRFRVKPPGGAYSPPIFQDPTARELHELLDNGNRINAVLRMFNPENGDGSLHIEISKGERAEVQGGQWLLEIVGVEIRDRNPLHAWLEELPSRDLFFVEHIDDEYTITIPGTAEHVITVGAIEIASTPSMMKAYRNSSSGPCRNGVEKPEVVAPGVGVRGARVGSGHGVDQQAMGKSGTSVAAPHVTGAIALALSARAKRAGQPQLNAFQIRSALQTVPNNLIWNETTGYGELDAFGLLELLDQA